jgi:TonB-linked SusC/RagA family outer membrane protein
MGANRFTRLRVFSRGKKLPKREEGHMRFTTSAIRQVGALAAALLIFGVSTPWAQQQQGTIAGSVTDRVAGSPLPGVRISVLNTNRSAVTNQEGRYTLAGVPVGTYQVQASLIGYGAATNTASVTAGGIETLDFALRPAAVSLDALVVTATGEQRGREVANVVTNIRADSLVPLSSVTNFGDLLAGRTANVQVLPSAGSVGAGTRVRIRGLNSLSLSNEPIYYIDGVRVESSSASLSVGTGGQSFSRINDINPEEIESVEIVKGPSAATLYGTQAVNGVIRITTKRGLAGRTNWNVYSEVGVLNDRNDYPTNYFSWGHDPAGAANQCFPLSAVTGACAIDSLTSYNILMDKDATINGTGYRGQAGLQVSGGTEQVQYFVSGEYDDELGHIRMPSGEYDRVAQERLVSELPYAQFRPNEVKKVSLRSNVQAQLRRNVDVSLKSGLVLSNGRLPQNDNNVTGMLPSGLFGKGFSGTRGAFGADWGFSRPGEVFAIVTEQDITRFTGSFNTTWRPTSQLSARATVGLDHTNRTDMQFQALEEGPNFSTFRQGRRSDNRFTINQWTVDVNGSGSFMLSPMLTSKTTVGIQYLKEFNFGVTADGSILPPGGKTVSSGALRTAGETTAESVTLGAYIEQVFGIRDRLFVTGALRTDDNSAFGKNFSAVYYPKAQISWVLSDEPFFPTSFPADNLRLRLAYGASGQQPGTTDAAQFYTGTTATIRQSDTPSLIVGSFGNPDLRPERSVELEVGFDAGFARETAHLEFTYYAKKTKDALIQRRLAPSLGGPVSQFENIGSVQNRGLEAVLNINTSLGSSIDLDLTLSGSRNTNKLLELGEGVSNIVQGQIRQVPGYPLFGYWDRPILGYRDVNGDGILTSAEVVVGDTAVFLGSSIPRTELSTNLGITLFNKRVRLGGQLDYRADFKANNFTDYFRCTSSAANNCAALNDPNAPLDQQARVIAGRTAAFGTTAAGFIEDADFLKLRELSFTYYAPEGIARLLRVNRASFTLTGRNLLSLTNYTGIDPELNGNGQNDAPIDFLTQPLVTYWTFRVNLGF